MKAHHAESLLAAVRWALGPSDLDDALDRLREIVAAIDADARATSNPETSREGTDGVA